MSSQRRRAVRLFGATVIFVGAFLLYRSNLALVAADTFRTNDNFFGADTADTVDIMSRATFDDDVWKHLLFSVTVHPLVRGVVRLTSADTRSAILTVLAALGAMNVAGVFLLLERHITAALSAWLLACFYGVCFSNLVLFSIPETYAMSNLIILLYLACLMRLREHLNVRNSLLLSAVASLGSLYNPPLLSLMTIHLMVMFQRNRRNWRPWIGMAVANLAAGTIIFFAVNIGVHGRAFLSFCHSYAAHWASVGNLLHPINFLSVALDFIFFSVVSPVASLPSTLSWQDIGGYFSSVPRLLLSIAFAIAMIFAVSMAIRKYREKQFLPMCLLGWVGLLVVFYTYFDYREAILFSSQVLLPLTVVMATAYDALRVKPIIKLTVLAVGTLSVAAANILTISR